MSFIQDVISRMSLCISVSILFLVGVGLCSAEDIQLDDPATWADPSFWKSLNPSGQITGWEFHDGEVTLSRPGGQSIMSKPIASDFELSFDWKIATKVNSGVKYRVRKHGAPYWNKAYQGAGYWGIEYQIYDEKPNTDALHTTGAIYDLATAALDKTVHPPGEWNAARIVANGSTV
ncbi:MAG: DUF1080 domain-containing protein, partial [Planctomycetaceae bacterium]|nr:DUF1080 domain-containing protein [Planctomycetaceae bacterium]